MRNVVWLVALAIGFAVPVAANEPADPPAPVAPAAPEPGKPPADARWQILVKDQLKSEKNCDLLEVLTYGEMQLGEEIAISGRVSCVDGREFDFNRYRPHQKFEFKLCEPSVC